MVPTASEKRVFAPVPFHSPVMTPITEEKSIVEAMTIAKEMYLNSPMRGSPAFWQTNCPTHMTPTSEANIQFLKIGPLPK